MKRIQLSILIVAITGTLLLSGCVQSHHRTVTPTGRTTVVKQTTTQPVATTTTRPIIVTEAPPPARTETIPTAAPSQAHAWVPGYWTHTGSRWVWVAGHWEMRPRTAAIWVPGHWDKDPGDRGWVWTSGHWE